MEKFKLLVKDDVKFINDTVLVEPNTKKDSVEIEENQNTDYPDALLMFWF